MTPLWLDLLRTPMAAPETPALRRMRLVWQLLCLALALVVGLFDPLHDVTGRVAPCLAAALLVATGLQTWAYLRRKKAADDAFLDASRERT